MTLLRINPIVAFFLALLGIVFLAGCTPAERAAWSVATAFEKGAGALAAQSQLDTLEGEGSLSAHSPDEQWYFYQETGVGRRIKNLDVDVRGSAKARGSGVPLSRTERAPLIGPRGPVGEIVDDTAPLRSSPTPPPPPASRPVGHMLPTDAEEGPRPAIAALTPTRRFGR